jgi:hypothetical protein
VNTPTKTFLTARLRILLSVLVAVGIVACFDQRPEADDEQGIDHAVTLSASGVGTSPSAVGQVHYAVWVDYTEDAARARAATGLKPDGNWWGGQGGHVTGVDAIAACATFAPRACEVRVWAGVAP